MSRHLVTILKSNGPPLMKIVIFGKSVLQFPDTGTLALDNTRPLWHSSIVCFWMPPARSKERKYRILGQYWYTRYAPVFTNTGTFQYLGPKVYIILIFKSFVISLIPLQCWMQNLTMHTYTSFASIDPQILKLYATPLKGLPQRGCNIGLNILFTVCLHKCFGFLPFLQLALS